MQRSLKEFAENKPKLAKELGILPNKNSRKKTMIVIKKKAKTMNSRKNGNVQIIVTTMMTSYRIDFRN